MQKRRIAKMEKTIIDLGKLKEQWGSAWIARNQVGKFTGGLVAPRTMANHDSFGTGPKRFKVKNKTGYQIDDFIAWLEGHIKTA
jgi:hypothetical protein